MSCSKCGSTPCCCAPASLANPIISGGVFNGPVINGPTINGGTINNSELVAVHIDIASTGETSPPGVCDEHLATNAFVCTAIANAISGSNPAFCAAVSACLLADSSALCVSVALCIATTPGIINTTGAFGINARATTAVHGVVRYALQSELEAGNCLLAVDPCTLIAAWTTPNLASPFWTAFTSAVCVAGATCLAPINSPAFTGTPTAPTPTVGLCNTQIATTAFVCTAINNAISGSNPAFCSAVAACTAAPSCGAVTALFPAAGGNPPAGTRFLGTDCASYTAAQIVATGGGGGSGGVSGGGCAAGLTTFTGPHGVPGSFGQMHAAWLGADNSAGAGFVSVLAIMGIKCLGNSGSNCQLGAAAWGAISNGDAAQIRAGACGAINFLNECACSEGGVQS